MKKRIQSWLTLASILILISGCGRPPGSGGQHGGYAVNGVVAPATEETIEVTVQLVGSLKARESIDVVSEINGVIAEIKFTEGQPVKAGDALVRIDDAKLKARLAEASARLNLAMTNFKRARNLVDSATISQQEFDQARAEFDVAEASFKLIEEELGDSDIVAPFAGTTSARMVSPGEYVTAGRPITRLVQMDPLEAEFNVPEAYASEVKMGQKIVMNSVALPDEEITGEVFFVDPIVNTDTRTVLVKALVPNHELRLKPGLFGKLDLVLAQRDNAIVVPESSVKYAGDQASVVVRNAEGKAEFRNVKVGERYPGKVEIIEGLEPGELVVVEGFQKMGPGTDIIISPASEKYGVSVEPPPAQAAAAE